MEAPRIVWYLEYLWRVWTLVFRHVVSMVTLPFSSTFFFWKLGTFISSSDKNIHKSGVSDPDSIGYLDPDPDWETVSGTRQTKKTQWKRKKSRSMVKQQKQCRVSTLQCSRSNFSFECQSRSRTGSSPKITQYTCWKIRILKFFIHSSTS